MRSILGGAHYRAWGELLGSVRGGGVAFEQALGMPVFEYFPKNPDEGRIFDDSMTALTAMVERAVLDAFDFSPFARIVDVGGGHAGFLASILRANPSAQGVLFDMPHVIEGAKDRIAAEGLAGRCEAVGGDFFRGVPKGGDLYLLKWIIHDWDDERSVAILENCREAMADGGKLLLIEAIIPAGNEPSLGIFMDINMMVMTGGRERTEGEFRTLLEASGFRMTRTLPTRSLVGLIEGVALGG